MSTKKEQNVMIEKKELLAAVDKYIDDKIVNLKDSLAENALFPLRRIFFSDENLSCNIKIYKKAKEILHNVIENEYTGVTKCQNEN